MNIFWEPLRFVEEIPVGELLKAQNEFFETALEIRSKLGKRAYLIDHYVSKVFSVINAKMTADMVEAGIRAYGELIHSIHLGADDENKELLSQVQGTKQTYRHYKGLYQEESTTRSMTAIVIKQEMLPGLVEKFIGDHLHALTCIYDVLRLNELYELIGKAVGEEIMERLNSLLKRSFLIAIPTSLFLQGFIQCFMEDLMAKDIETNKEIFQLWLDELARNKERESGGISEC